jgi:hypothetical protein
VLYLGRIVTKHDTEEPEVMRNLARARAKWASMRRFLVRDAADPKIMATFYRAVVLYVLLYGSDGESWVLTGDFGETTSEFSSEMLPRIDRSGLVGGIVTIVVLIIFIVNFFFASIFFILYSLSSSWCRPRLQQCLRPRNNRPAHCPCS